jgi:hypothetical protein
MPTEYQSDAARCKYLKGRKRLEVPCKFRAVMVASAKVPLSPETCLLGASASKRGSCAHIQSWQLRYNGPGDAFVRSSSPLRTAVLTKDSVIIATSCDQKSFAAGLVNKSFSVRAVSQIDRIASPLILAAS